MNSQAAIATAGILVTLIAGFAGVIWRVSKLEFKLDLMWDWYLKSHADLLPGGRRKSDPPES